MLEMGVSIFKVSIIVNPYFSNITTEAAVRVLCRFQKAIAHIFKSALHYGK